MLDEYFGIKELQHVTLRAKTPMQFGARQIEADEPVLYFENVSMSLLQESNRVRMARGGWANMPKVIWNDKSEVTFTLSEGVISSISMAILLDSFATTPTKANPLLVNKREGPFNIDTDRRVYLEHWPVDSNIKKTFIFDYERDVAQKKIYGKRISGIMDPFEPTKERPCLELYEDKNLQVPADINKNYVIDYYYEYESEALIYTIEKERFNGLFTLEGTFYTKDENDGINYSNILYMPKVRIVSDINLRLGERADPSVGVFNVIGLPEVLPGKKDGVLLEITHLDQDINSDI